MIEGGDPIPKDETYFFLLEQSTASTSSISQGNGLIETQFQVSPSTTALTCMYVDSRSGSGNTQVPSTLLNVYAANGITPESSKLTRHYISYGNQTYPKNQSTSAFSADVDYLGDIYTSNLMQNGQYFDVMSTPETQAEWIARGLYIHHETPSSPEGGRSSTVTVSQEFDATAHAAFRQVMLVSHHTDVCRVVVKDHKCSMVEVGGR